MTKQEYIHIRNLAWDLIIDAKISRLPVDINAIANIYNLQHLIDNSKSLYDNALSVSEGILQIFGMSKSEFTRHLTVRVLAPMIILKELDIKSAEELSDFSGLPANLANQRFKHLKMLLSKNVIHTSRHEYIILSRFRKWIKVVNPYLKVPR